MISVIVERAPADRQGPDITDQLLTADPPARERGRNEIDRNSTNRSLVSLSGPYRGWRQPGELLHYIGRRGSWVGMVRRSSLTIHRDGDEFRADMALEIEREAS